ncbi:MAG: WXG100 family type VII secretion target [Actinobacteria bacterium]|nr:WXG100 family type VII secretion target [Actinomycetota bacterium]
MALEGMDVAAVQQLAQLLNQKADDINSTMQQLNGQINNSTSIWVGNDANQFRSEWQSTHVQQLNAVVNGLHDAAQKAIQNAQQQEQASGS